MSSITPVVSSESMHDWNSSACESDMTPELLNAGPFAPQFTSSGVELSKIPSFETASSAEKDITPGGCK